MTVYRRPDPIPLHRSRPAADFALRAVRAESEDLHKLVSWQIFAAIRSGRYPQGSVLPNEMMLGKELGVSRTALREAVKGLVSKNMLETRRRRGTLVLDSNQWNLLDPEVIGWLRRDDGPIVSEQLWQSFAAILPGIAALAAGRRTSPRLPDGPMGIDARFRFLMNLALAGDNRFLISVASASLQNLIDADLPFFDKASAWLDETAAYELAGLIKAGRAADASAWLSAKLATRPGIAATRRIEA